LSTTIRIGTRGSKLALWQADWVTSRLQALYPDLQLEREIIKTLECALLEDRVDLLVHSLKDVPTQPVDGILTVAIPERADPRDAFFGKNGLKLAELPQGARVATGSLRRRAQLRVLRPDVEIVDLRGNIDTRIRKLLEQDDLQGIILAHAGVSRIGLTEHISEVLEPSRWVPAPGQGALAIQTRTAAAAIVPLLAALDHASTHAAVVAERAVLARLEGGCHVPMGAYATEKNGQIELNAFVADLDGVRMLRARESGPAADAEAIGDRAGRDLLARGGAAILAELAARCDGGN
jgi:hydroxymethylbilane synthase